MTPPAFAAGRRAAAPAAVDRYVLRAERSAAKPPHAAAAVKRGTDRQTDARPLHRSCFAHYVGSANKQRCCLVAKLILVIDGF